jgi:uncharacterized protein (DUF2336 family)
MTKLLRRLFGKTVDPNSERLSYDEAKQLAQSVDPDVRRRLAARPDVVPELLYYLAEDPVPAVRREIASNAAAPAQANLLLASDADETVRSGLAAKIARLAPGLTTEEQDRLRRTTHEALQLLARDQVTRVRQILADALKDVAHAPPEVIRRLARDAELAVSGPVLEFSPVLTDDDLLEIIHSGPASGALSAISRRTEVHALVADAIANTDDAAAIAVLLGNPSAQIREETLDRLIVRAPAHEEWHGPLVHRPHLPARAAARLAHFVADNLVQTLQQRRDLDPETAAAVAAAVRKRLDERGPPEVRQAKPDHAVDKPLEVARKMHDSGILDEPMLANALASNDRDFVMAGLSVRADLPLDLVHKIIVTQSAKGIVSLAWKAGMSMPFAVQLQTRLARLAPADVLGPKRGAGYPLVVEEMAWQLKFFSSLAGGDE